MPTVYFICLFYLKEQNLPSWFLPHLYSSQPCESLFRQLRSLTSTYSTVACCSVNEILYRISKIQMQNEIVSSNAENFIYPKSSHKKINEKSNGKTIVHELPTKSEIFNVIALCIKTANQFGFEIPADSMLISRQISAKCLSKRTIKKKKNTKTIINSFTKPLMKVSDLKNVQLKNYIASHSNPDETSPFVQLGAKKVVKKTSLCWYLRNDYQKISADRTKRVMALTENDYLTKKESNSATNVGTFKCRSYAYKPIKNTKKILVSKVKSINKKNRKL